MSEGLSVIEIVLREQRGELLDAWVKAQMAATGVRTDLISESELRVESDNFLVALQHAVSADSAAPDINDPRWPGYIGNGLATEDVLVAPPNAKNVTPASGMFPTPSAGDNRDRGNPNMPAIQRRLAKGKQMNLSMTVSTERGALSPDWVEWLQGLPVGWTTVEDHAIDSKRLQTRSDEVLSAMRGAHDPQALWDALGGLGRIPSQEVLRQALHGAGDGEARALASRFASPLSGAESAPSGMPDVRGDEQSGPAPSGWEPGEQRANELDDAVRLVSHALALAARQNETVYGWEVEPNIPRVGLGIPNRSKRLTALGNAVVPAQAVFAWERLTERLGLE